MVTLGAAVIALTVALIAARRADDGPPHGAVLRCAMRSEAGFPAAFSDPRNLVVGPLVLVGAAADLPARAVRALGGAKFPALVRAGHRVTVALSAATRRSTGLDYGPHLQGRARHPRDAAGVVTFVACRRGERSGSSAGRMAVTFWSGFVLTTTPRCVPLSAWVDDERSPRRTAIRLGVRRCP